MFSIIFSLRLFCLAIIVVFVALPTSDGADNWYKTCSSLLFTCGNLTNIGYPFWGDGRPKNCGHPALQLQCLDNQEGNYSILNIDPKELTPYHIPKITSFDGNTTIILQGAPDTPCGPYGKDFGDVLQFSKGIEMINLLYNCTNPIVPNHSDGPKGSVTCYQNETAFEVYYRSNMSAHGKFASCKSGVAPVFRNQLDRYNKQKLNFPDVLKQGFEVYFEYTSDCIKCKTSGCLCGSSSTSNFTCLCKPAKRKPTLGIAVTVGVVVILAAVCVCFYYYKKRKSRSPAFQQRMIPTDLMTSDFDISSSFDGIAVFSYNELQEATNNFDATQELGDGGFGIVYYGKLKDGREVAVKRLYEKSYRQVGQFMNEVEIVTRLRHPNLVTLYGCTSHHSKDLLLVYEYVSNGTVADHVHGDRKGSKALTWPIRMKIAIETASALSYLHTSEIVHRDVKTTNILLDNNFSAKLADFGLSRLFPFNTTHVSTTLQGTPGYLDPEYHKCYQVTNKSDVYSFGVVLIELISSLPAVDITRRENEINLSDYAMNRIQSGMVDDLVDEKLGYNSDFKVKRMITLVAELAFQCLQQEKEVRPFMTEVLEALMRIEEMDYKALEANEMENKPPPSPSSVIDNWAMKSSTSNPSS